jgi:divalent metal cation (Fe/Co/Zn/Cd) transporter
LTGSGRWRSASCCWGSRCSLLIGEAASPELQRTIEAEFAGTPGIRRVIHTLTQHIGPDELLIAAKIEFEPELTTRELVDTINEAERRVRGAAGRARIYVEPDIGAPESIIEAAPE